MMVSEYATRIYDDAYTSDNYEVTYGYCNSNRTSHNRDYDVICYEAEDNYFDDCSDEVYNG